MSRTADHAGDLIVGVDGSEPSRRALAWAAAVAADRQVAVRVVGSWAYPASAGTPFGPSHLPPPEEMDAATLGELRAVVDDVLGADAGVQVEVGRGPAAAVLLAAAEREGASMLVLGARGLGGFDGMLLGSVTQRCVEYPPCPVVVVRGDAPPVAPPRHVVVGVDGSEGAARALAFAIDVVDGGRILAVHGPGNAVGIDIANMAREDLEGPWSDPLRASGVAHTLRLERSDPRSALVEVPEDVGADLVVVGTRGHGAVQGMVIGSVAAHLVRYATRPVAVVP